MACAEELSANRQEIPFPDKADGSWRIKQISLEEYQKLEEHHKIFTEISKYKSKNYYINRYYNHPIYKYGFYGIIKDNDICSVFVTRECGNGTAKCLRIVDYIGKTDNLIYVRTDLKELMEKFGYEYIDFVVVGADYDVLKKAGFINRKEHPETIIPNYFEPFLKKILIWIMRSNQSIRKRWHCFIKRMRIRTDLICYNTEISCRNSRYIQDMGIKLYEVSTIYCI